MRKLIMALAIMAAAGLACPGTVIGDDLDKIKDMVEDEIKKAIGGDKDSSKKKSAAKKPAKKMVDKDKASGGAKKASTGKAYNKGTKKKGDGKGYKKGSGKGYKKGDGKGYNKGGQGRKKGDGKGYNKGGQGRKKGDGKGYNKGGKAGAGSGQKKAKARKVERRGPPAHAVGAARGADEDDAEYYEEEMEEAGDDDRGPSEQARNNIARQKIKEQNKHNDRLARLERLREVMKDKGDDKAVREIDGLIAKEQARHGRKLEGISEREEKFDEAAGEPEDEGYYYEEGDEGGYYEEGEGYYYEEE